MTGAMGDSLRVEELARRADVSVDTIRFYQKRRLLAAARPHGPHRLVRARAPRPADPHPRPPAPGLLPRGHPPSARRRARPGRRARSPRRSPAPRPTRRPSQLLTPRRARRAVGRARAAARSGRARRHPRCRSATTATPASLRPTPRSSRSGCACSRPACRSPSCSRSPAVTTTRRARSPRRPSRCSTRTCANRCARPDLTDDERAEQLVAAFRTLLPTVTSLVAHHFRRVLLEVAQEHLERGRRVDRARGRERGAGLGSGDRRDRLRAHAVAASSPKGPRSAQAVEEMFDRVAPGYDRMNRIISLGRDTGWRRRTVDALGLPRGSLVLDLACGTGDLCRDLADCRLPRRSASTSPPGCWRPARTGAPLVRGDAQTLAAARPGRRRHRVRIRAAQLRRCSRRVRRVRTGAPARRPLRGARRSRARARDHARRQHGVVPGRGAAARARSRPRRRRVPLPPAFDGLPAAAGARCSATCTQPGFAGAARRTMTGGSVQLITGTRA